MRKTLLAGFVILFTGFVLSSFAPKSSDPVTVLERALTNAENLYYTNLDQLKQAQKAYVEASVAFAQGKLDLPTLQSRHLEARKAYKRAEYLMAYMDAEAVKMYINGAPLPTIDRTQPGILVLEPEGFQILDELVFSESPKEESESIQTFTKKLESELSETIRYVKINRLQHRMIFEAAREEIIRVFTLGLTGFDTPGGSAQAVEEAHTSLASIYAALEGYLIGAKSTNPELSTDLDELFQEALDYLAKHPDFETFDRTYFLRSYINPLFDQVYQLQRALSIETIEETAPFTPKYDHRANSFFKSDFFNKEVYASVSKKHMTNQKRIELGRLLFFDPILSSNNERSCASCHNPDKAFTDGMDKSLAMGGVSKIKRNAPTVINSIFAEKFFYDLREEVLERQIKHVVLDHREFNTDFFKILEKLEKSEEYQQLFKEAYADQPQYAFSKWSFTNAISIYLSSLTSFNSPFDQYVRGETAEIDPAVARGFNIFMGKGACGTCHFAPTFNGLVPPYFKESESEVLGVPATKDTLNPPIDPDLGRIVSGIPHDEAYFYQFSFKTPTVRNVALTGPYMHNGVYDSLEEVMDFYNRGGGAGMGIDIPHQTLPFDNLSLEKGEINDVIAFMESLTDTVGMTQMPSRLPVFENNPEWNKRKIGGAY